MVFHSRFPLAFLGLILGSLLIMASQLRRPFLSEHRSLIAPPPQLQFFSFGFQPVIADSLWIRAIQDFDYCEEQVEKNLCKNNSWLYQMLNAITELSPDFVEVYREGAIALSVITSDISGASKIFDKGVILHPNDFNLSYRAAYHYLYEEKNKKKAAQQFEHAARLLGAKGDWLYSLSVRLYTDAGQREVALQLYNQMKQESQLDEKMLQRMREKLGIKDE